MAVVKEAVNKVADKAESFINLVLEIREACTGVETSGQAKAKIAYIKNLIDEKVDK